MKTENQVVAYVRVSSQDQNTARQMAEIEKHNPTRIFEEKVSGKDTNRPELQALIAYVREGDEVIVHSLDRLARSLPDLRSLVDEINGKGATVTFLKNSLTFKPAENADPASVLMLNVLGAIAEFERSIIKERQAEGIARAKAENKYKGRTKMMRRDGKIKELLDSGLTVRAVAEEVGCSKSTVQTVKNSLKK